MNAERRGYASPRAVEQALKQAARNAFRVDPSLSVQDRIQLAHFDRLLARVFSSESAEDWVLKGGVGILARTASARSTTDIDLFARDGSLNEALDELQGAARSDLGDHFRFELVGSRAIIGGNHNPYTKGVAATFDVYVGVQKRGKINVDLVVDALVTGEVEVVIPAHSLELPRLVSVPYNIYPVVDQIADKVCASLSTYRGAESSREKDFVDLMLFATTSELCGSGLQKAIRVEAAARGLTLPSSFSVPSKWGVVYEEQAANLPALKDHLDAASARSLLSTLLDPVLEQDSFDGRWDPKELRWR